MTRINWHDILQDLLDEHLPLLSGHPVQFATRELEEKSRYDYYCELDLDQKISSEDVYRPLGHLKQFNVIEFKAYRDTLTSEGFFEYLSRLFKVMGRPDKRGSRWDKSTLTILLAHYPRKFFGECKSRNHLVTKESPWLYRVEAIIGLPVYILVLPGLRNQDLGFPAALLQALEPDPNYQPKMWERILQKQANFVNKLKRIIMRVNKGGFMNYLDQLKAEAQAEIKAELAERDILLNKERAEREKERAEREKDQLLIAKLKQKLAELTGSKPGDLSFS